MEKMRNAHKICVWKPLGRRIDGEDKKERDVRTLKGNKDSHFCWELTLMAENTSCIHCMSVNI
jgi:hypothetical protein